MILKSNVVLTGFMATGKSTVGRLLAKGLDYEFVDTDDLIEKRSGKPIAEIFKQNGEQVFRKWETEAAIETGMRPGLVVATGGGMMQNPANTAAFNRQGQIYCLTASLDQIMERITRDENTVRPLLQVPDFKKCIRELMAFRESVYAQFIQLDTTGKTPQQVAAELSVIHAGLVTVE